MLLSLWLIYSQYIIGRTLNLALWLHAFGRSQLKVFIIGWFRALLLCFFFLSTKYYTLLTVYLTLVVKELSMAARLCLRYIRRVKDLEVVRGCIFSIEKFSR